MKGTIQQKDITIVNIHAPNTGAPNYIKHYSNQTQTDPSTNMRVTSTHLSHWERGHPNMNSTKNLQTWKNIKNLTSQMLTSANRQKISCDNSQIHFLLRCSWNLLQNREYIRAQRNKNFYIIPCILSDHKGNEIRNRHTHKLYRLHKHTRG